MDDITVEVCGENGAWYKVCRKKYFYPITTQKQKKNAEKKNLRNENKRKLIPIEKQSVQ